MTSIERISVDIDDSVWRQLRATAAKGALAFMVALARFRRTVTPSSPQE